MNISSTRDYEDDIDLLRYGRFLGSYWLLLVACAVIGMTVAVVVRYRTPVKYQASAMMAVNPGGGTTGLTPASARALLANLSLISETINELQLSRFGLTPQSFADRALELQSVPTTNLLRVSVSLPDPTSARLAANALALKAVELSRRLDQAGAATERDAIKKQTEEAAARLDAAQERLLSFQSDAQIDVLETDADSKLHGRSQLDSVAIELDAERARLARMEEELTRQPPVLGSPRPEGTEVTLNQPAEGPRPNPTESRTRRTSVSDQPSQKPREETEGTRTRAGARGDTNNSKPHGSSAARRDSPPTRGRSSSDRETSDSRDDKSSTRPAPTRDSAPTRDGSPRGSVPPAPAEASFGMASSVDSENRFSNPVYSMLQYEVAKSRAKVAAIERQLRGMQGEAGSRQANDFRKLYQKRIELRRLEADYAVSEHVYSDLAERYEEVRSRAVGIMPQLQIVDAPVQPDRPLPRRLAQFAILGALIGFAFGVVAAVLLNRRRSRQGAGV